MLLPSSLVRCTFLLDFIIFVSVFCHPRVSFVDPLPHVFLPSCFSPCLRIIYHLVNGLRVWFRSRLFFYLLTCYNLFLSVERRDWSGRVSHDDPVEVHSMKMMMMTLVTKSKAGLCITRRRRSATETTDISFHAC